MCWVFLLEDFCVYCSFTKPCLRFDDFLHVVRLGQRHVEDARIKCNDDAEKANHDGRVATSVKDDAVAVVLFTETLLRLLVWPVAVVALVELAIDLDMKVEEGFAVHVEQSRGLRHTAVSLDVIDKHTVKARGFDKTLHRFEAFVEIKVFVELRLNAAKVDDALPRSLRNMRIGRYSKGLARIRCRAYFFACFLCPISAFFFVGPFHVCELVHRIGSKIPLLFHVCQAAKLFASLFVVS